MLKLESLLKKYTEVNQESETLEAQRQHAKGELDGALNSVSEGKMDLEDPKLARKVSDAQFTIQLVAARWEAVQRQLKKLPVEISAEWDEKARILLKIRGAKLDDLELQLQKDLERYCESGSKSAKKLAAELAGELYAFRYLAKKIPCNRPGGIGPGGTTAVLIDMARIFLQQARAAIKEFDLKIS